MRKTQKVYRKTEDKNKKILMKKGEILMDSNQMSNQVNNQINNQINNIPEEYRPLSMWAYFGYQLLFSIPCIGFIFLLVFALGGAKNINLRNFARSYFCYLIVMIIIIVILFLLIGGIAASGMLY